MILNGLQLTDDGEVMKLYFSDMWLSKSPFCDTDDGDLYISMNIKLKINGQS